MYDLLTLSFVNSINYYHAALSKSHQLYSKPILFGRIPGKFQQSQVLCCSWSILDTRLWLVGLITYWIPFALTATHVRSQWLANGSRQHSFPPSPNWYLSFFLFMALNKTYTWNKESNLVTDFFPHKTRISLNSLFKSFKLTRLKSLRFSFITVGIIIMNSSNNEIHHIWPLIEIDPSCSWYLKSCAFYAHDIAEFD